MKEMISKAYDRKQNIQFFLVNIKKSLKKTKMIWPNSNQNIFSEDVTMEPTRYLWAKLQPLILGV